MDSQRPISVDGEVAALSRGADRDSLFMQAQLALPGGGGPVTVRVRNPSPGGMLAEAKVTVAKGATVEVDLRNSGPVAVRSLWAAEGKLGIRPESPPVGTACGRTCSARMGPYQKQ